MQLVAHRANQDGPSDTENTRAAIDRCMEAGLMCEIDVRHHDGQIFLGHDKPQEAIQVRYLSDRASRLLIHCKDLAALTYLRPYKVLDIVGHSNDEFVLTSRGHVFCRVGVVAAGCVCVMPELHTEEITAEMVRQCSHVVTDYPRRYV